MTGIPTDTECERVVADLLAMMSPVEKAGQLALRQAPERDDRDGMDQLVRDLCAGRVGSVRGIVNREQADYLQQIALEKSRLGIPLLFPTETGTGIETIFPNPLAACASWDMDAIERAEGVIADEAHRRGFNWAFAPDVIISDHIGEMVGQSYGNDALLASRVAAARVRGLQGAGVRRDHSMLACLDLSGTVSQHDSVERDATTLLAIAHAAISDAKVGSIAYDGLTEEARHAVDKAFSFLKGPGGFDGILLSEWERLAREIAGTELGGGREGVPVDALVAALKSKRIALERVDDAVSRILRAKFRSGLLSAPLTASFRHSASSLPTPVHNREVARDLARRCIILLRNDPAYLPLGIDSGDILIVGGAANDRRSPLAGRGGIAASVIDGFEQLGIPHRYVPGLALRGNGEPASGMIAADSMAIGMAREAAKRAGTVVLVLSIPPGADLGDANTQLLAGLASANPRLVLVTLGAEPVDPQISGRNLPCILHAGQLGTMSGHAIAEILTGETSPSGKLPLDIPGTDGKPSLPFGHGLTYSDFALTNLSVELGPDRAYLFADLLNTGKLEAVETVQLFIGRVSEGEDTKRRRMPLAAFRRVRLRPAERETLTFEIGREEIGEHFADGSFRVEGGTFDLFLGLSAERGMRGTLTIPANAARAMASAALHPLPDPQTLHGRRQA